MDFAFQHVVKPENSCSTAVTSAVNQVVPFGQWQTSANGSDVERNTIEFVAAVYDWCHDQISTSSPGSTILGTSSTTGQDQPLTVGSTNGMGVGFVLRLDAGGNQEDATIISVTTAHMLWCKT